MWRTHHPLLHVVMHELWVEVRGWGPMARHVMTRWAHARGRHPGT